MEHTPGPWRVVRPEYTNEHLTRIVPRVRQDGSFPFYCSLGGENREANARLIAAAPELLEACRELLEWTRDCVLNAHTLEKIEAAITKAEPVR